MISMPNGVTTPTPTFALVLSGGEAGDGDEAKSGLVVIECGTVVVEGNDVVLALNDIIVLAATVFLAGGASPRVDNRPNSEPPAMVIVSTKPRAVVTTTSITTLEQGGVPKYFTSALSATDAN